ncbi:hypothetical protein GCM10011608_09140 [Micromonospora sonchi]|uniref:Uncharacterized protein n=1 Tax=Micromonospora sonchi TaxID=1763543 RepID=A0A917TKL6_9ACTN|nr:hypothetical protein [Micromonospora sonchi]GGM26546.1 hypothetical protein GCM10011608_09140 [Micromonospora sonchi]
MTRSLRKRVTAPDGRSYSGRWPQQIPHTGEGPFIAALARTVNGACEVVLPVGRADVATSTTIFEVEPAARWRAGLRQVLAYAGQTGQRPALALFGAADYLKIFLFIRDRLPGTSLWVYRGHWVEVSSRAKARFAHRPEYDVPPAFGELASVPLPDVHPFDSHVSPDVIDPWERARRAALFERAHLAGVEMRRASA